MPFKYDDDGNIEQREPDGGGHKLPVYETKDGKEILYDPTVPNTRLRQARDSAQTLEQQVQTLEGQLAAFKGIEDPKAMLTELETLRKRAVKKPKAKGEGEGDDGEDYSEQINILSQERDSLHRKVENYEAQLKEAQDAITAGEERTRRLSVGAAFKTTPWFNFYLDDDGNRRSAKTTMEYVAAESQFGQHFNVVGMNGKDRVIATWTPGGKDVIYSEKNPEEPANFDEAVGLLFAKWPRKNHYLPSNGPGGMNARESGGNAGGTGTMSRDAFEKLGPVEKKAFMKDGGKLVDSAR